MPTVSKAGVILPLRRYRYLAMSGDTSLSQPGGVGYYYYLAAKHPLMHERAPDNKELSGSKFQ